MAITAAELLVKVGYDASDVDKGLADTKGKIDSEGGRLSSGLGAIGAAAGLAGGAALAAGMWGAISAESGTDRLAAQLGINNPEFAADLGKMAGSIYGQNYGASLEEVNAGLQGVIGKGLVSEDATNAEIEAMTAKVLTLSDVFGQDLGAATNAVSQMLKTGLAPNADAAMDILTRGFQQGGDKAGDMLDTFNEYGTQFRKVGVDGGTAMGLITQGLQAGARDADIVADSIKEFSIRAIDGSKLTAEGFAALGLNGAEMAAKIAAGGPEAAGALDMTLDRLRAMEDPTARSAAAVALFGTQAEDMGDALFALDPSNAVRGLGNLEGSASKLADTMGGNAAASFETLKRQGLMALTNAAQTYLLPVLQRIPGLISTVTKFFDENRVALVLVGGVIGGLLVGAFLAWAVSAGAAAVATIAATAPLLLLAAGIGLLVAGLIYAWQNFEGFRTVVETVFATVQTVVSTVIGVVQTVITTFVSTVMGLWESWGGVISTVVTTYFGLVRTYIETVLGVIMGIWNVFAGLFTGDWDRVWQGIKGIVSSVWDGIKSAISIAIDGAWAIVQDVGGKIVGWFTGLPGKMAGVFDGMFDGIWAAFKWPINQIISAWNNLEFGIPGFDPPGPGPTFPGITIGTPNLPRLATGGDIVGGGWAITGEKGPELGYWPAGAQVRPLSNAPASSVHNEVTVIMPPGSNGDDVVSALRKWQRTNGALPLKVTN